MFPTLETGRFTTQTGYTLTVEVPEERADAVVDAILTVVPLRWGDYDRVAFRSLPGLQQFRALGTGPPPTGCRPRTAEPFSRLCSPADRGAPPTGYG